MVGVIDTLVEGLVEDVDTLDPEHEGATAVVINPDGQVKGYQIGNSVDKHAPEFVSNEDYPFFMTTVIFTLDCVAEWAKYKAKEENTPDKKTVWNGLEYALERSELLHRMIEGKPTFVERPPRSHGGSWYKLLEDGEDIVQSVEFTKFRVGTGFAAPLGEEEFVNLNGGSWDIVEVKENNQYVVIYSGSDTRYLLRRATKEDQNRLLHPRVERSERLNAWIITREEDNGGDTGA